MQTATRLAILADIHGNLAALHAVLADVRAVSPDMLVWGGDLVMNGPRPAATLALVRAVGGWGVVGNTDLDVVAGEDPVSAWTRAQIGADELEYLRSLPLMQRITPPNGTSPRDDLLVVHSTPRDCNDLLILAVHPLGTSFTATTPLAEAQAMLNGERANLIVYGHIHYASEATINKQRVKSVGSVGFPFDADQRAAYALVQWNGTNWQIEHRRVEYDWRAVIADIEQCIIPFAACYAERIRRADWLPCPPNDAS